MIYDFSSGLGALNAGIANLGKGLENAYQWQLGEQIVNSLPGLNGQPAAAPAAGGLGSLPATGSYNASGKTPTFARGGGNSIASMDPVAQGLTPQQAALLNGISAGESGGKYNIRYTPQGGATFALNGQHPGIVEQGPHGGSTAAGRYQFTKTTWDAVTGGNVPFTPENQDKYAIVLAQRDYKARTGRDLDADLATEGFSPRIQAALAPTWAALKGNQGRNTSAYAATLERFGQGQPAPAAGSGLSLAQAVSPENNPSPRQLTWEEQRAQGQPAPVQVASTDPTIGVSGLPSAVPPVGLPSFAGPGGVSVAPPGAKVLPAEVMAPPGATAFPGSRGAPQTVAPPTAGAGPAPVATASTPPVAPPPPPPREQPSQAAQVAQPAPVQPVAQPAAAFSNGRMDPALKSVIALMIRDPQTRAQGIALYREAVKPNVSHIDLGNSIGIMDAAGNIIRTLPKDRDPITVGENSTLIDPNTRQVIYQGQPKQKLEPIKDRQGNITGIWDATAGRTLTPDEMKKRGVTLPQAGDAGSAPMFGGNSVEAQSLNYLVQQGIITKEQAADIGAGKIYDGPNGEKLFFTPRSIVGAARSGQPPVPEPVPGQQGAQTVPNPMASDAQPAAPAAPAQAPAAGPRQILPPTPDKSKEPSPKELADLRTLASTRTTLKGALQNLQTQVEKYGAQALPTREAATMGTTMKDVQLQLKNLYELGAITGPDWQIMNSLLMDPTINLMDPTTWSRGINTKERIGGQIEALNKIIDRIVESRAGALGITLPAEAPPPAAPPTREELEAEARRRGLLK